MSRSRSSLPRPHHFAFNFLLIATLLTLPLLTSGVSLSDFIPRASNLTPTCSTVYNAQISACTASDFSTGACSSTCINALVAVNADVYSACSASAQDDVLLIAAFLDGNGISAVCPNVVVTTVGGGNSMSLTTTPGVSIGTITSVVFSTTSSTGIPLASGTEVLTSTTALPSTIVVDTASGPGPRASPTSTASVATTLSSGSILTSSASSVSSMTTLQVSAPTVETVVTHQSSSASASLTTTTAILPTSSNTLTTTAGLLITASSSLSTSIINTGTFSTTSSSTTSLPTVQSDSSSCGSHGGSPIDYCSGASSSFSAWRRESTMCKITASWMMLGILWWLVGCLRHEMSDSRKEIAKWRL